MFAMYKKKLKLLQEDMATLQEDIHRATEMIRQASQNDFSAFDKAQEFKKAHALQDALQEMRGRVQAYRQSEQSTMWVMQGQGKFSELIREDFQGTEDLCEKILHFLIQYLEIHQGGFFLHREVNENEAYLDLVSCYAYNRKKFLQKEILIQNGFAEGLIGEAYLERKIIHLDEVPSDYLKIDSGLGQASPKELLMFPLYTQEKGLGLIELATFQSFKPQHIELVQHLGQNISAAIAQVQSTETMQNLLQESRQIAEQMAAQESAMRQSQEEMVATQEEILKRNLQLENLEKKYQDELATKQAEIQSLEEKLQASQTELEAKKHNILLLQEEEQNKRNRDQKISEEKLVELVEKYKIQEDSLKAQLAEKEKLLEQIQKENLAKN